MDCRDDEDATKCVGGQSDPSRHRQEAPADVASARSANVSTQATDL